MLVRQEGENDRSVYQFSACWDLLGPFQIGTRGEASRDLADRDQLILFQRQPGEQIRWSDSAASEPWNLIQPALIPAP